MTPSADVLVVGAGPAGLAAAIHAARAGLSPVVLDPHRGVIDKACGEGIMPGGVEELEALGVRPAGIPFMGVDYIDAQDASLRAGGIFPSGFGLGVRRTVLHAAMRERACALGVRFLEGRLEGFEQEDDAVVVNGALRARWLIGADGLRSRVRRLLGVESPARARPRVGLRRHFAIRPWTDRVEVHFGPRADAYVTPVDGTTVGVAVLFEALRDRPSFDELLAGFPLLARRLQGRPPASRARGAGPFEQRVARRAVGHVLLIGDAAGYLDPLTGEGIALGLGTARAAIASVLEGAPERYERRYRRLTRRWFAVTAALLAMTRRRRWQTPFLQVVRACPAAFDAALGMLGHLPVDAASAPARPLGGESLAFGLDHLP